MGKPLEGSSGLEAIGKPSKTLLEDTLASQSKIFLSQLGTLRGYLEKAGNDKVNGDAEAEKRAPTTFFEERKRSLAVRGFEIPELTNLEIVVQSIIDEKGCLQSETVVETFISAMTCSVTLEQRSLCIAVLSASSKNAGDNQSALCSFVSLGGLRILNNWLFELVVTSADADQEAASKHLLRLALDMLQDMPVTHSALLQSEITSILKKIKELDYLDDKSLKLCIKAIRKRWQEQSHKTLNEFVALEERIVAFRKDQEAKALKLKKEEEKREALNKPSPSKKEPPTRPSPVQVPNSTASPGAQKSPATLIPSPAGPKRSPAGEDTQRSLFKGEKRGRAGHPVGKIGGRQAKSPRIRVLNSDDPSGIRHTADKNLAHFDTETLEADAMDISASDWAPVAVKDDEGLTLELESGPATETLGMAIPHTSPPPARSSPPILNRAVEDALQSRPLLQKQRSMNSHWETKLKWADDHEGGRLEHVRLFEVYGDQKPGRQESRAWKDLLMKERGEGEARAVLGKVNFPPEEEVMPHWSRAKLLPSSLRIEKEIASAELAKQRERAGAKMETIYFNSSEIPLTPLEDIRDREVGRKGVVVRIPYDEKEEDEGSDEVEGGSARSDSAVASQSTEERTKEMLRKLPPSAQQALSARVLQDTAAMREFTRFLSDGNEQGLNALANDALHTPPDMPLRSLQRITQSYSSAPLSYQSPHAAQLAAPPSAGPLMSQPSYSQRQTASMRYGPLPQQPPVQPQQYPVGYAPGMHSRGLHDYPQQPLYYHPQQNVPSSYHPTAPHSTGYGYPGGSVTEPSVPNQSIYSQPTPAIYQGGQEVNYARGDMRGGDNRIDRDAARYGDRSREPSPYSRERADSRERSRDRYRDRDRVPGNDRREREYCTFFNKRGGCKRGDDCLYIHDRNHA